MGSTAPKIENQVAASVGSLGNTGYRNKCILLFSPVCMSFRESHAAESPPQSARGLTSLLFHSQRII